MQAQKPTACIVDISSKNSTMSLVDRFGEQ